MRVAVVLVVLAVPLLCLAAVEEEEAEIRDGGSFHLQLTPPLPAPESAEARRQHYRAMVAKDQLRQRRMAAGEAARRQMGEVAASSNASAFQLPMRSALNVAHVGMYLVTVRIGTPALPFSMALDTAADLTWLNCRLQRRKGKHYGRPAKPAAATIQEIDTDNGGGRPAVKVVKNWYRPALSSSWHRYRCSQTELCGMLLPYTQCLCQSIDQTESCTYQHESEDGTLTRGIFGQDKATVALSSGQMAKLPGVMLGCSTFEDGTAVAAHDGVLALGNHDKSFGVTAAKRFGGRFSFCLLNANSSRNTSSYLTFGPNPAVDGPGVMEAPLNYPGSTAAYGPQVTRVLVAGEPLDIPPAVWDYSLLGGGVRLDTGTSLTTLVPAAYRAVTAALDQKLTETLKRYSEGVEGFEFCYHSDSGGLEAVPAFAVELEGGARLEPGAVGIVIPEVVPGVACLAFQSVRMGPSIIGNVLMQEHIWEVDLLNSKLRFRKDKCINQPRHPKHHP